MGGGRRRDGPDRHADGAGVLLGRFLRRASDRRGARCVGACRRGRFLSAQPLPVSSAGRLALAAWPCSAPGRPSRSRGRRSAAEPRTTCNGCSSTSALPRFARLLREPRCAPRLEPALALGAFRGGPSMGSRSACCPDCSSSSAAPRPSAGSNSRSPTGTPSVSWRPSGSIRRSLRASPATRSGRGVRMVLAAAGGVALGLGVYLSFARGALAGARRGPARAGRARAGEARAAAQHRDRDRRLGSRRCVAGALPTVNSLAPGEKGSRARGSSCWPLVALALVAAFLAAALVPRRPSASFPFPVFSPADP